MDAMNAPAFLTAQTIVSVAVLVIVVHVILLTVAYSIYLERKISAYIQDRIGPNRVGPLGLLQPIADGLKFLLKEDFTPPRADRILFTLAPMVSIIPALIGFAVIPWGGRWDVPEFSFLGWHVPAQRVVVAGADLDIGVIYLIAVASLGVYGVTLGGWASNNKYSFLGGLRCTAQMLAYEIPLGLTLLAMLLLFGTVYPQTMIEHQAVRGWGILYQPLAAILFFSAILAEANRAPFDNPEAEQELVGGYHTEYSSMRFAMFFLAEYAHMITSCAFFALLFLGGYHVPLVPGLSPWDTGLWAAVAKFVVFFGKVVLLICFMMVVRWTLPRLRFDQVMMVAWQAVIPLALVLVVGTAAMVYLGRTGLLPMLGVNVVVALGVVLVYPYLPSYTANRRVPLYGSRFSPVPGQRVATRPAEPLALEDRPGDLVSAR